jgi:tetratricopeptide (TPR) repeat protein
MNKHSLACFILFLAAVMPLIVDTQNTKEEEKLYRMIRSGEYKKAEKFCKNQRGTFQDNCYRILAGAQFGPQIEAWVLRSEDEKIEKLCRNLKNRMQQECMRITGDAYLENEQPGKAAQFYEKANYPEGNSGVALKYLKKGDIENAGKYFEKGVTSARRARGYGKLAEHYKRSGEINLVAKYLKAAIADYETLIKDIDYEWNESDCQDRLRFIKEEEALSGLPLEQSEQTRLNQLLKQSALYCSKLEQSLFHFYCREEVYERLHYIDGYSHYPEKPVETLRRFDYEYQVIRDKDKITENRKPLRVDKVPFRHERPMQKPIVFDHRYLIYGPIALFGENRQSLYKYSILKEETSQGEKVMVIDVIPLYLQVPALQFGKARVKVSDGSIIGIEWNPKSIRNFQALLEKTGGDNISPYLSFSLELHVVKDNVHFPSKCRIEWHREKIDKTLIGIARKKGFALTGAVTDIIYKDYRFFTVGTEIIETIIPDKSVKDESSFTSSRNSPNPVRGQFLQTSNSVFIFRFSFISLSILPFFR